MCIIINEGSDILYKSNGTLLHNIFCSQVYYKGKGILNKILNNDI